MAESINQRGADDLAISKVIFDGAISRLRLVLLTIITSALGLISATQLTLFVLAVVRKVFTRQNQGS